MTNPATERTQFNGGQQGTNGLGLAGFIVSIVGLISCPLVSLVGAILSGVGMRREPRGFAIAGLIIGLVGMVLTTIVSLGIFLPAISAARRAAREAITRADGLELVTAITRYQNANRSLPPTLDVLGVGADAAEDPWGNPYRYSVNADGRGYVLTSDGFDGIAGTRDDVTVHPEPR